jgi:hypothetical protein
MNEKEGELTNKFVAQKRFFFQLENEMEKRRNG